MFTLSRTNIPVVVVGVPIDDRNFRAGDTAAWLAPIRAALRAARGAGAPLTGRVRLARNMVLRVIGAEPEDGFSAALQHLVTLGEDHDNLSLWADVHLADDNVVLD